MLELRGVSAGYGPARILFDITLEAKAGEVVVLLGRNGAGKSTTLRAVMGLLPLQSGEVSFEGRRIDGLPPYRIARLGLGYVPEDRRIFTDLTVSENLEVGRQAIRMDAPHWKPEHLFELFPNLGRMQDRLGGRMSGGEQQMLTIARTLMGNPKAVLLDEPSEGLAPVIVEQMALTILELKKNGLCVLLCEQNLHFAHLVGDRAYVIEKGHLRYTGSMAELGRDHAVREQYLSV